MAEAQAQNKLGELFVDIGVGGLGKTLKALNSVSASFLLTKNAATQAVTPLLNMTKEGASLATTLSKISAATGLAETKLLALKRVENLNTIEANTLINTLEGLQQKILGAKMGTDTASMQAFQLMGLNPLELSEKDPIKAFDEIKKRVETLSPEVQTMALNLLGMNKELTYVYKQLNGSLEENVNRAEQQYKVSEEQLKNLQEQQESFNKIKVAAEQIKINIAGWKFTQELINGIADLMTLIAQKGFIEAGKEKLKENYTIENTDENKEKLEYIKRNPYRFLPKWLKSTDFIIEQEQKRIEWYDKTHPQTSNKKSDIFIGDEKFEGTTNTVAASVGATPVQPNGNINNGTLPTLPNAAATTTNNTTSTVNVNNYWNNQFEIMGNGSAEQAYQIQEYLNSQQNLAEFTNTPHI